MNHTAHSCFNIIITTKSICAAVLLYSKPFLAFPLYLIISIIVILASISFFYYYCNTILVVMIEPTNILILQNMKCVWCRQWKIAVPANINYGTNSKV